MTIRHKMKLINKSCPDQNGDNWSLREEAIVFRPIMAEQSNATCLLSVSWQWLLIRLEQWEPLWVWKEQAAVPAGTTNQEPCSWMEAPPQKVFPRDNPTQRQASNIHHHSVQCKTHLDKWNGFGHFEPKTVEFCFKKSIFEISHKYTFSQCLFSNS